MVTSDEKKSITEELGIDDARGKEMFKFVVDIIPNHESISDIMKTLICSDFNTKEIIVMSYLVGVFNENPEEFMNAFKTMKMLEFMEEFKNKHF
jgi:hypothetical protein